MGSFPNATVATVLWRCATAIGAIGVFHHIWDQGPSSTWSCCEVQDGSRIHPEKTYLYILTVKLIGIKSDLSLMQILGQAISETENHAFEHHPTPSSPTSHKYCASQMYSQRSLAMAEYHGDLFSRPNPKTLPRRNADLFKRYPPGCEPSSLGRAKPRAAVISAPDFVGFSHFSRACLIMFMDWGHSFSFNINLYSISVFTISIWIDIY